MGVRKIKTIRKEYDVVVIGGGLAGICAAISASRLGVKTALIHDRPVLGGNSSAEIGVPVCGADQHGAYRNSRETGIIDELFSENAHFNPFDSRSLWSIVLWYMCKREKNLELFLNTIAKEPKVKNNHIRSIIAEQYTTEKIFVIKARMFIDCSGDGRVAYESGAEFMIGRESRAKFKESLAPKKHDRYTMGNSIYMHARDVGRPVKFKPPEWAYDYPEEVFGNDRPHSLHQISATPEGGYWWTDLGGKLDTISDAEEIRDALIKYAFGVWDHIKNHGQHNAENYVLESINVIPGKRESRRFKGDYILVQKDVESLRNFHDAVAYGGWFIDVHQPTGLKVKLPSKYLECLKSLQGRYTIPFRCLYSKNIKNLMFAGRNISASHIALGSTRVMATCAIMGQAVGVAAYLTIKYRTSPRGIYERHMKELQQTLLKQDCYIPGVKNEDENDLARYAKLTASSETKLEVPRPSQYKPLDRARAQSFVISEPRIDGVAFYFENKTGKSVSINIYLRKGEFIDDFRDDANLAVSKATIPVGKSKVKFSLHLKNLDQNAPYWVLFYPKKNVSLGYTNSEPVGTQAGETGKEGLSFIWRIRGTYSFELFPQSFPYKVDQLISGVTRPEKSTNIWISKPGLPQWVELQWPNPIVFNTLYLTFDNNLDRYLKKWYELKVAPELVKDYKIYIYNQQWKEILYVRNNYQRHRIHKFNRKIKASKLKLEILNTNGTEVAKVYEIRVYNE